MRVELVENPSPALRQEIAARLLAFNAANGLTPDKQPVAIVVRDDGGRMIGGLWGETSYGWLYVDLLVVEEAARGADLGSRLMDMAEDVARSRNCAHAWLSTFSFQARGFYEKRGYEVFSELEQSPNETVRLLLRKTL